MTSALWRAWHEETTAWAYRASDDLLATFDHDVIKTAEERRETTVALYGPTQVGKTTLVLRLLGIAETAFEYVEAVLRGGRTAGKSATAVPMLYARSQDEHWRIGAWDSPPLDAEAVTVQLAELRAQVEAGNYQALDPVALLFPADMFADGDPPVRVRLLDLPGGRADAEHERKLVRRIADRYLPRVSLVLLVSMADNLGVFDPDKLKNDFDMLRDWMRHKARYRLVTTRSYTLASVREAVDAGKINDVADLQGEILKEFSRFEEVQRKQDVSDLRFYPLEHGDSWVNLARSNPGYYRWAEGVQRSVLLNLAEDIASSCDAQPRLNIGQAVAKEIRHRYAGLRAEFIAKVMARQQRHVAAKKEIRRLKIAFDQEATALTRCEDDLRHIEHLEQALPKAAAHRFANAVAQKPGHAVKDVHDWLDTAIASIDEGLAACRTDLGLDKIDRPSVSPFLGLRERLDGFFYRNFDYWPSVSSCYEDDVADGRKAIQAYAREAEHIIRRATKEHLTKRLKENRGQHKTIMRRKDLLRGRISDVEEQERLDMQDWTAHRRDYIVRLLAARGNLQRADAFDTHMTLAYHDEARRIIAAMRDAVRTPSPVAAFARLCQLRLASRFYRDHCTSIIK